MPVKRNLGKSVDSFIGKGADVKTEKNKNFKNILIRVPLGILSDLDALVEKKPWINRTQWIVEAIHEKLQENSYV